MCPPSTPISIEVTPEAAFSRTSSALRAIDRKSTRLNSSHLVISYAVFCLKKKKHYLKHPARFAGDDRRPPGTHHYGHFGCPIRSTPCSYPDRRHPLILLAWVAARSCLLASCT